MKNKINMSWDNLVEIIKWISSNSFNFHTDDVKFRVVNINDIELLHSGEVIKLLDALKWKIRSDGDTLISCTILIDHLLNNISIVKDKERFNFVDIFSDDEIEIEVATYNE